MACVVLGLRCLPLPVRSFLQVTADNSSQGQNRPCSSTPFKNKKCGILMVTSSDVKEEERQKDNCCCCCCCCCCCFFSPGRGVRPGTDLTVPYSNARCSYRRAMQANGFLFSFCCGRRCCYRRAMQAQCFAKGVQPAGGRGQKKKRMKKNIKT